MGVGEKLESISGGKHDMFRTNHSMYGSTHVQNGVKSSLILPSMEGTPKPESEAMQDVNLSVENLGTPTYLNKSSHGKDMEYKMKMNLRAKLCFRG